jgi:TnpA family transposase
MLARSKRLSVLSEVDQFALYGLPDFDEGQRFEYFTFTEQELNLISNRKHLHNKVFCALQLGYFKAKQMFFTFSWNQIPKEDIVFIARHYFSMRSINKLHITKHEYYSQRNDIVGLFNYRLWSRKFTNILQQQATQVAQRDITPHFIALELITFLQKEKIIRPRYTTLQTIISDVLTKERKRLGALVISMLDKDTKNRLNALLVRESSLSELAALKQDAKDFKFRMMALERKKKEILEPLHFVAKRILPHFAISKQNIEYYASLADYYTIYDLRRLSVKQSYLYLLCYSWKRYQQLNDNLIDAIGYHLTQAKNATKDEAKKMFVQVNQGQKSASIGRLLLVYTDEAINDNIPFGEVRKQAFSIMPKNIINNTGKQLCDPKKTQLFYRWQAIDKFVNRFKKHLRPLFMSLDFAATTNVYNQWLTALTWFKQVFLAQQNLQHQQISKCPEGTIPKRLKPYLLKDNQTNNPSLLADRYEYWIYQQIYKNFRNGAIYLKNSIRHRNFNGELIPKNKVAVTLKELRIPWEQNSIGQQLDDLFATLRELWISFNDELKQGKFKHLHYDPETNLLSWRKPRINNEEEVTENFYSKLPFKDIIDILRFVNQKCNFLSALTPLQPRYGKSEWEEDFLLATIISQAMNYGNTNMAEMGDITYSILENTYHQRLRLDTLNKSNDIISTAITKLPIFPYYSLDLIELYSSVDGQKYNVRHPTTKARNSKKYFRKGKGVVAYTWLVNHIPLQSQIIGAHDHESYFLFDIYYNNSTDIVPTVITGDMHALNKANFAIMYCFGVKLEIRFTNLQDQLKHLYIGQIYDQNQHWLIKPVGQIDRQLIEKEKKNIDRIIATLGLKEITQNDLVKKLCTYTENRTFKAFFELDKLLRSISTLRYLRDYQLQRKVHRSQNRIESYHQLRAAIAKVGGNGKELAGRTDVAVEVSNQCGRLIANAMVYYNSVILSRLLEKYLTKDDQKAIAKLKKVSPVAWQHAYFQGHYTFRSNKNPIDLDAIIADLVLG